MFAVSEAFTQHEVVPDVIPTAPEKGLTIIYENDAKVDFGAPLTPTQVKDMPKHIEWEADKDAFYTLIMTDPDATSRKNPRYRECMHWLVINIPGNNIAAGHILTEYAGSGPPKDTGLHRYVFLVYKQPGKLSETIQNRISNVHLEGRLRWSAAKFAEAHHLRNPVAGNFFQAEHDAFCDVHRKKMLKHNIFFIIKSIFCCRL